VHAEEFVKKGEEVGRERPVFVLEIAVGDLTVEDAPRDGGFAGRVDEDIAELSVKEEEEEKVERKKEEIGGGLFRPFRQEEMPEAGNGFRIAARGFHDGLKIP